MVKIKCDSCGQIRYSASPDSHRCECGGHYCIEPNTPAMEAKTLPSLPPPGWGRKGVRKLMLAALALGFCINAQYVFAGTPSLGTITPSNGVSAPNQQVSFATTFSDPSGWQHIQYAYFLINASLDYKNCFYGYYDQNKNKLYLRNDASSKWLGGFVPGSSSVIENPYVKLDCSRSAVSGSGTTLTVNWNITFKSTFTGSKNAYLYVQDDKRATAGWTLKGAWSIQSGDGVAPTGSIKINNGNQYANSASVTLNLSAQDNAGGSGLSQMQFSNTNTTWSTAESYATAKSWTLASGEGTKTVYVKYKDAAGNWSQSYSDSIVLDTTPPAIIIDSPQDQAIVAEPSVQLTGTVDGATFSESRALVEGENTLTKSATDSAGNAAFASVRVYYYQGTVIGTGGGEVVSDDGKVRVIIPQGALSQPQAICVSNINKDNLAGAAPAGSALLSVVECKPYGLVFNKPIQILYTLYQAEIPGTSVELGFYDSVQNKILPTGQASIVPQDGYTLSFYLLHFSTYAAIKNLTSQGIPIGSGVQIPLPDMFTGAFSHAIPLAVPPGRKGLQPSLGLAYRSSNQNSWVGLGFSLNPGVIIRSTRLGPAAYIDTQDTYYLVTDAGTTELVHLIDNLYQAKIESAFSKFYKETADSWRVVAKDGSVLRFGEAAEAKETSPQGTFCWYVTKAVDTNGNFIEFHYSKDRGKAYLARIEYTGNEIGISPTHSVEFLLEARTDVPSSYISGSKVATAKRLKEIQVKINSDLVWRYELAYDYSPDTGRSLLKSVTQYGADGKSVPPKQFKYQKAR